MLTIISWHLVIPYKGINTGINFANEISSIGGN